MGGVANGSGWHYEVMSLGFRGRWLGHCATGAVPQSQPAEVPACYLFK